MKKDSTRRNFLKNSAYAVGGAFMLDSTPLRAATKSLSSRKKFKVIDFRCRPPLKSFGGLFKMRVEMFQNRPNTLANPATFGKVPRSVESFMQGDEDAMKLWWDEIDECAIESVVVAGRYIQDQPAMSMDTDELLKYEKRYSGRFYAIAPIAIDVSIEQTMQKLQNDLNKGVRGVTIEPGYRTKGGATTIDNKDFFPIYELLQEKGIFLQVQTGAFANPFSFKEPNEMWRFDTVLREFPKLRIVLGHGGYPSITEALALALKWPSVTISSDVYTFWPGGQLYQQNIEMLQDQFVYGSAYPFGNFKETLEQTLELSLSEKVFEKYLYCNARKLLNLE